MSNYPRAVQWTRFRDGPRSPPRTDMKLLRKYNVFIDDGLVGYVLGESLQHARERAVLYYQITADQQVKIVEVDD